MENLLIHLPFWIVGAFAVVNSIIISADTPRLKSTLNLRLTLLSLGVFCLYVGFVLLDSDNVRAKPAGVLIILMFIPFILAIPFYKRKTLESSMQGERHFTDEDMFKNSNDISRFELENEKDH